MSITMWARHGALLTLVTLLSSWSCLAASIGNLGGQESTVDSLGSGSYVARRADPNLAGYLGVFFLGADPYVYFYLSNGNDALSFKALNKGTPIMKPTKGTGGVRDPTIIPGGGSEAGRKWYIIGTDLNIGKVRQPRAKGPAIMRWGRDMALLTLRNLRRTGMPHSDRVRRGSLSGRVRTL